MLAVRVQDYYGFRECSCFCPQISKTHAKGASCTTGCEPGIGIAKADAFYYCVIIKEYWGKNKKSQGIFVVKSLCTLHRLNTNLRKRVGNCGIGATDRMAKCVYQNHNLLEFHLQIKIFCAHFLSENNE